MEKQKSKQKATKAKVIKPTYTAKGIKKTFGKNKRTTAIIRGYGNLYGIIKRVPIIAMDNSDYTVTLNINGEKTIFDMNMGFEDDPMVIGYTGYQLDINELMYNYELMPEFETF